MPPLVFSPPVTGPLLSLSPGLTPITNSTLSIFYGGWSPADLRRSDLGQKFMDPCPWYDEFSLACPAGTYDVQPFVPETSGLDLTSQVSHLSRHLPGWEATPLAIAVTAILVRLSQGQEFPDHIIRVAEFLPKDGRLQICVRHGKLFIESRFWDHNCDPRMHLSAYRLTP